MSDEHMGWDDERLEAAFRGLAASAPLPPGLVAATVAAVRETSARPRRGSLRPALLGLAGVAVAAVLVVAVAAWPRATSMPPVVGSAIPVAELPVIDVPALLARMDEPTPGEVIVRGWFAVAPVEADCEVVEDPHPLIPDCEEWYRFLAAEPDELHWPRGGTIQPTGPYVVPMLRIDSHIGIATGGETVEVLAVGHIADHRVGTCPEAEQPECARRFVIDRLLPAGAEVVDLPDPWLASAPPTSGAEDAVRALADVVGPVSVVSIGAITAADLPSIEPIAAGDEPVGDRTLWVVRAFVGDQPVARTFTLVDGAVDTSPVSEITATSVSDVSAATPTNQPSPDASSSEAPSAGPISGGEFVILDDDGPVTIELRDASGVVTSMRAATPTELARPGGEPGPSDLSIEVLGSGALIRWVGTVCDGALTLGVTREDTYQNDAATVLRVRLGGQRDPCEAMGIPRGVVLGLGQQPSRIIGVNEQATSAFPVEVAGLPVIDIDAARRVRVRPGDARELAIAGWYEHPPTMDCLPVEDPTLLSRGCPGDVDDPHLLDADGDPGVHLIVATPIERPTPGGDPVPVVVIGHFDDRRAEACPVERRTECQNAFVVDVIWMDGRLGAGAWELATDRSVLAPAVTRDWVSRAIRKVGPGPGAHLLSVGQVRGPDLARIEPGGIGAVLAAEIWVWHATVLFGDEIWTFLLPDDDLVSFVETGTVHGYQIFDAGLQEFTSVDGPPRGSPPPSP